MDEDQKDKIIKYLWNLLDDIDTLDDICKKDDISFRKSTMKIQKKKELTGITSDGYTINLSNMTIPEEQND